MPETDIAEVCHHVPWTSVVAVHMEAINHCLLSRNELKDFLDSQNLSQEVLIPADGESMEFS